MTVKSTGSMSLKRYIKLATERQEANKRFNQGAQNFDEVERIDRRFWLAVFPVTERFGINAVREAEVDAGILESNGAWS